MPPKKAPAKKVSVKKKTAVKKAPAKRGKRSKEEKKNEDDVEDNVDNVDNVYNVDNSEDGNVDDVEDEEEYFDESTFNNLDSKLKYHVFNPEKYTREPNREIMIVPREHRKTSEVMTSYEYTEIVSHRAKQLENGGVCFADIGKESNFVRMAEMEILQKKCPLSIRRLYNESLGEIWEVNEMVIPPNMIS